MGEADATWHRAVGAFAATGIGFLIVVLPAVGQDIASRPEPWQLRGTMAALSDPDEEVWVRALNRLGEFELTRSQQQQLLADERYHDIVSFLTEDRSDALQASALRAIAVTGNGTEQTALKIIPLLQDTDAAVRQAAVEALARQQTRRHLRHIFPRLQDSELNVRLAAIGAIGQMGDREHASYLIPFLAPPSPADRGDLRPAVLQALVALNARDRSADILPLLLNSNTNLRQAASQALGQLDARDRIPDLLPLLQDPRWQVREAASQTLGELSATAEIPHIATLLQSQSWPVRQVAVQTLEQLDARETIPLIARRLDDSEADVRAAAALALGQLEAAELADRLVPLLQDDTVAVRQAAIAALGQLGIGEYSSAVLFLLGDRDSNVRRATIQTLVQLNAREALPDMLPLLRDRDTDVRQATVAALGQLEASNALPHLLPLLEDESVAVQRATGQVVGQLINAEQTSAERAGADHVESILALLQHRQWSVRQVGLQILGQIEASDRVPQVLALLQDSRPEVRLTTLATWEQLAPHALDTLSPLLDKMYASSTSERPQLRFLAYYGSGGHPDIVTAIAWLGRPLERPTIATDTQRIQLLEQLYLLWPDTAESDHLRSDIAQLMAQLVKDGDWEHGWLQGRRDRALLRKLEALLQQDGFPVRADTVRAAYGGILQGRRLVLLGRYIIGHAITWLMVWLLYPMSTPIQIVVWHPWVRRILGHVYIGWLLTRVPFLRARLLRTWRTPVSGGKFYVGNGIHSEPSVHPTTATSDRDVYDYRLHAASTPFPACDIHEPAESTHEASQIRSPQTSTSPRYSRHTVLVRLQADCCVRGVEAAIRTEMGRVVSIINLDPAFFSALIRNGAITICLEQIDQASSLAQRNIKRFAQRYPRVPIQIAIRSPEESRPHSSHDRLTWQPLSPSQVAERISTLLPVEPQIDRPIDTVQNHGMAEENTPVDGTSNV